MTRYLGAMIVSMVLCGMSDARAYYLAYWDGCGITVCCYDGFDYVGSVSTSYEDPNEIPDNICDGAGLSSGSGDDQQITMEEADKMGLEIPDLGIPFNKGEICSVRPNVRNR